MNQAPTIYSIPLVQGFNLLNPPFLFKRMIDKFSLFIYKIKNVGLMNQAPTIYFLIPLSLLFDSNLIQNNYITF